MKTSKAVIAFLLGFCILTVCGQESVQNVPSETAESLPASETSPTPSPEPTQSEIEQILKQGVYEIQDVSGGLLGCIDVSGEDITLYDETGKEIGKESYSYDAFTGKYSVTSGKVYDIERTVLCLKATEEESAEVLLLVPEENDHIDQLRRTANESNKWTLQIGSRFEEDSSGTSKLFVGGYGDTGLYLNLPYDLTNSIRVKDGHLFVSDMSSGIILSFDGAVYPSAYDGGTDEHRNQYCDTISEELVSSAIQELYKYSPPEELPPPQDRVLYGIPWRIYEIAKLAEIGCNYQTVACYADESAEMLISVKISALSVDNLQEVQANCISMLERLISGLEVVDRPQEAKGVECLQAIPAFSSLRWGDSMDTAEEKIRVPVKRIVFEMQEGEWFYSLSDSGENQFDFFGFPCSSFGGIFFDYDSKVGLGWLRYTVSGTNCSYDELTDTFKEVFGAPDEEYTNEYGGLEANWFNVERTTIHIFESESSDDVSVWFVSEEIVGG